MRADTQTTTKGSTASQARISARLSLEEAAKRARICPAYLRRVEREGHASYVLALRLSALYGCSLNVFLDPTNGR